MSVEMGLYSKHCFASGSCTTSYQTVYFPKQKIVLETLVSALPTCIRKQAGLTNLVTRPVGNGKSISMGVQISERQTICITHQSVILTGFLSLFPFFIVMHF